MAPRKKIVEEVIENVEVKEEEKLSAKSTTPKTNNSSEKLPYIIIIVLLIIIVILAFFVGKNYDTILNGKISNLNIKTNSGSVVSDIIIKIIGDKRCSDCQTDLITASLKQVPFLAGAKFEEVDFADEGIKDFVKANDVKTLPAYLFNTNAFSDSQFVQYLTQTPSGLYNLSVGSQFDPLAEICGNNTDDNEDGLIDCADSKCSKDISCAPKVERPVADLYIMSYCPYGLQAQKGYLEAMSKLSKFADINIKFVQYVMHGQKEADENVVQYCIQKNEKDKYTKYLNCFLAEEGKAEACRKEAGINETGLTSCIDETKKQFSVDEKMKDISKQYPDFDIDKESALATGVQGSPTFVLNGIKLDKMGRNAKAYADAICSTMKNRPKICDDNEFQDVNFDPMFGFTSNGSNASSGCGK